MERDDPQFSIDAAVKGNLPMPKHTFWGSRVTRHWERETVWHYLLSRHLRESRQNQYKAVERWSRDEQWDAHGGIELCITEDREDARGSIALESWEHHDAIDFKWGRDYRRGSEEYRAWLRLKHDAALATLRQKKDARGEAFCEAEALFMMGERKEKCLEGPRYRCRWATKTI
jgi:hypothetical protein